MPENRIKNLVENNLIKYTKENIQLLLNKDYYKELVILVNSGDEDEQNECVDQILNLEPEDDIVYMLINSNISVENALKLLNIISDDALIEKIDLDRDELIEEVLDKRLSNENIQYITENFDTFKLKDRFILNLIDNDMLCDLNYNCLTDSFMKYILSHSDVTIDNKIGLLSTVISNSSNMDQIKNYLQCIQDVAEIVTVWEGKYPALDNEYKEKIADTLIKKKIAKKRKDNKLMLR